MGENGRGKDRRTVVQFYNRLNLGDDLLVHLLVSRYGNDFSIPRTSSSSLSAHSNVMMIDRSRRTQMVDRVRSKFSLGSPPNHSELSRASRDHDALIHIGGSIFIEHEGSIDHWQREVEYYASLRVPYFIVDANFGPYRSPEFPDLIRRILGGAVDVCLRDEESYARFADLGNVRFAPDLGFTTGSIPSAFELEFDVVFSVMDLTLTHGEQIARSYDRACANALREMLSNGKRVCIMSFCEFQGDVRAARRIVALADITPEDDDRVLVYSYSGDLEEALGIMSTAEMIVGTRFHAIVVGLALAIPTLPLIYSKKTTHMLHEIGFSGQVADFTSSTGVESLSDVLPTCLDSEQLKRVRANAELQFLGVDRFLGGGQS